jgi:hypothetical protein
MYFFERFKHFFETLTQFFKTLMFRKNSFMFQKLVLVKISALYFKQNTDTMYNY